MAIIILLQLSIVSKLQIYSFDMLEFFLKDKQDGNNVWDRFIPSEDSDVYPHVSTAPLRVAFIVVVVGTKGLSEFYGNLRTHHLKII